MSTGGREGAGDGAGAAPGSPPAPEEAAFGDERLTVMGLLAETFTGIATRGMSRLAAHGISLVEFEILIRLVRTPEGMLRMTDLAAQTSLTASGVTRVVDRLADRGLVTRQACATDRRSTYAVVTHAGRSLMAEALPEHLALLEEWLVAPLREAGELERFASTLRMLRDRAVPCATAGSEGPAPDGVPTPDAPDGMPTPDAPDGIPVPAAPEVGLVPGTSVRPAGIG